VHGGVGGLSTAVPSVPPVLARQRNLILIVLLVLAAVGWYVVVDQASAHDAMHSTTMGDRGAMDGNAMSDGSMDGAMARPDLTMGTATIFFTMWVAMMVAMMFPAAAPIVLMYARMRKSDPVSVVVFTGAYIALWVAFGALAFGLGRFVEDRAASSLWFGNNWARLAGGLLVAAGIYQLTPLKDICLRHCRSPLGFVMAHWRDGRGGAARMGLRHGLFCVGCCWLLFLILVPLGIMNIAAMIVVTLLVFAEKVLPWGRAAGRVAAAVLVAYGVLVLVRPGALPTAV
jgi:predicted metal-binding membrane protein